MSLYEALDQFVGVGVLAAAGVVGCELASGTPLDGTHFSRFLRERRYGDEFGMVLDALAHEIWLAQEQRGFPQRVCEGHAATIAVLMSHVRLTSADLGAAIEAAKRQIDHALGNASASGTARGLIAETWMARARAGGHLLQASLIEDVVRFLLEQMFHYVIEQPRLMTGLKAALSEYKALVELPAIAAAQPRAVAAPQPAAPAPAGAMNGARHGAVAPNGAITKPANEDVPVAVSIGTVEEIKARHGLQDSALKRLQAILATQGLSTEQRHARLDELAGWLSATVAQLTQKTNDPPELTRLKASAAAALAQGDLERAMELLGEVRSVLRDGRRRIEARLAEEIEALRRQMVEEASAIARLAELALARSEFERAAGLFAEAAGNLPVSARGVEIDYRQRQAEALAAGAELAGDQRLLAEAANAFRSALGMVDKAGDPAAYARISVGLGDMLMALGARNAASTVELDQAVASYAEATSVIDRATHPMRWALVELSRAAGLIELGQRKERERYWLAAAQALMPALEVFEARGAMDLAEAARGKLRMLHGALLPASAPLQLPRRA